MVLDSTQRNGKHVNGTAGVPRLKTRTFSPGHERARKPFGESESSDHKRVAIAETVAKQFFGNGRGGGLFGLVPSRAGASELTHPYFESWVTFACTRKLADAVSSVPMRIRESSKQNADEIPESHPIAQLFRKPREDVSWAQAADAAMVHRVISGEDIWFLADDDGNPVATDSEGKITQPPTQIINVSGDMARERRDSTGQIIEWGYTAAGATKEVIFPAASVVVFRTYDPTDQQRGVGPCEVALRQLSMAFQLERWAEAAARNGGPGAWLICPKDLGEEQNRTVQTQVDAMFKDPETVASAKVLDGAEWKVIPNPANPKEMQVVEQLRDNAVVICSTLGVPPPCIGILNEARYKSMDEAWRQFWLGVAAYLWAQADVINAHLFGRFKDPKLAQLRIVPDLSDIDALRVDESDRYIKAKDFAFGNGLTLNEACAAFGLAPIKSPGADIAWVKTGFVTLEQALAGPEEPATNPDPEQPAGEPTKGAQFSRKLFDSVLPLNEAERKAYSEQYILRVFAPFEPRLKRKVLAWLKAYRTAQLAQLRAFAEGDGKAQLGALTKAIDDLSDIEAEILLDRAKWAKYLDTATRATIEATWQFSLEDAAAQIPGGISLPMSDPRVIEAMREQLVRLTEGVTSRLADVVKDTIVEALRESTATGTLQQRIKENLDEINGKLDSNRVFGMNDTRASRIARTETGKAASSARFSQFQEEGVEEIQWISEHDELVRESHKQVDGQVVRLGERFANGLLYPSEPDAPAAECVNCRCGYIAIVPALEAAA